MKNRTVQLIIVVLLLVGVGYVVYTNITKTKSIISVGKEAPNFTLVNLLGEEFSLTDYRGKGVVLNFWATYCKPCLNEMPALQRQYDKYKEQGIVVIGVDTGENAATVSGYIRRLGVNYLILLDPGYQVVNLYQVGPIPHTIYIEPDGKVKSVIIGEMSEETIEKHIIEILPK